MDKKLITVLTIGRTGSNYFCDFIDKSFTNINVNYELFNKNKCCIQKKIKKRVLKLYDNINDISGNLHEKVKDDPFQLLVNISNLCEEENIMFKLFLDHLSMDKSHNILSYSSLVVFLKRHYLDVYISNEKASLVNKYSNIDTTNIKIKFDPHKYESKVNYYDKYYHILRDFIIENNIPYVDIHYEPFHKLNIKEQQFFLKDIFDKYLIGNNIQMNENIDEIRFFKQDQCSSYRDKIENYDEFLEYFKQKNKICNGV
jgi:hypothetical protein